MYELLGEAWRCGPRIPVDSPAKASRGRTATVASVAPIAVCGTWTGTARWSPPQSEVFIEERDELRPECLHGWIKGQLHVAPSPPRRSTRIRRAYQVLHTQPGRSLKWLTILRLTGHGTKTDPPQEVDLLDGEKILITGVTGKIAFPIARTLAARQRGLGRGAPARSRDSDKLVAAGVTPVPLDLSVGDLSALPNDFTYVFHSAVDVGTDDWRRCLASERAQLRRTALSLPRGKGIRALLHRIGLRVPGPPGP